MEEEVKNSSGNDIVKSFAKKYALGLGILISVVVVWLILFYWPISSHLSETSSGLANWNNKLKEASLSEELVDDLAGKVDALKLEIANIEKRIFYLEDMPAIGKQLISYGNSYNLRTVAMTPNYDVLFEVDELVGQDQPLVKLPLELKLVGRYTALGEFISHVGQLPFIFAPEGFQLQADPQIYPNIEITVSGFLVLMSQEKEGTQIRGAKRSKKVSKG